VEVSPLRPTNAGTKVTEGLFILGPKDFHFEWIWATLPRQSSLSTGTQRQRQRQAPPARQATNGCQCVGVIRPEVLPRAQRRAWRTFFHALNKEKASRWELVGPPGPCRKQRARRQSSSKARPAARPTSGRL